MAAPSPPTEPCELAILNIGYADGYLRGFSEPGRARIGETFAPVVGRVSMDLTAIRVDEAPELAEGDWVELDFDLPAAAAQSGSANTSCSRRWARASAHLGLNPEAGPAVHAAMASIAHLSDLHFGAHDPVVVAGAEAWLPRCGPTSSWSAAISPSARPKTNIARPAPSWPGSRRRD